MKRGWLVLFVSVGGIAAGATSYADDDQGAVAEALFRSGRELMAQDRYAEACPKFAESLQLDRRLGTLMNLALCHEKEGKTASAWAEYVQAGEIAKRSGQTDREQLTRERARALEPGLPRVIVEAAAIPGLSVTLADKPIGSGAYGTPVPVDPGDHVVRATAPGKMPYTASFALSGGSGEAHRIPIPELEPEAASPPLAANGAGALGAQATPSTSPETQSSQAGNVQRSVGLATGAAGVASLVIGGVFGLVAKSTYDHALASECGGSYGSCSAAGVQDGKTAQSQAVVSTIAFGAGAALCAGGAILFFTAPTGGSGIVPVAGPREAGVVARGVW